MYRNRGIFAIAVSLTVMWASGLHVQLAKGQVQVKTENKKNTDRQPTRQDDILKRIRQEIVDEEKFIADFVLLAPQERIRLWGKETGEVPQTYMDHALIALGLDASPYLAEVVRHGNSSQRIHAVEILCDMDRFVPEENLPIPNFGWSVYVKSLNLKGRLNPFMDVDGRRIGKQGYEAIMWAAAQTNHDDLRFHARKESGLLKQDLWRLPFHEQIEQWRAAVINSKGALNLDKDASSLMEILQDILIEHAPETIPPLIGMLENDQNGYVREAALMTLYHIDGHQMRLRGKEIGRQAITAMLKALERGGMKPMLAQRSGQEWMRKRISNEIYHDNFYDIQWSLMAVAFDTFYGERTIKRLNGALGSVSIDPDIKRFIAYLTEIDPFFPSWEYTYADQDQMLHPLFEKKMGRYYEHWQRFKAVRKVFTIKN